MEIHCGNPRIFYKLDETMQYIFGWHMDFGEFGYKVVWSRASFVICCKLLDLILYIIQPLKAVSLGAS